MSIVTPMFNNEAYVAECIESVLSQTYDNWDYTIVNNCSTDGSGEIARQYAARDHRIRVLENQTFLPSVANHNVALRQIAPNSKYCKIVFSDDWIFPRCVEEMVSAAEDQPSVGIVGAYGLWEILDGDKHKHEVAWGGLPYPSRCVSGRDICRSFFLDDTYVFGTATSLLYRSDLVRERHSFYNEDNFHADKEACVTLLKGSDFAFVHQVLTFTRARPASLNKISVHMHLDIGCALQTLMGHGQDFLTKEEFDRLVQRRVAEYYNFLAVNFMRARRDAVFWAFHEKKLKEAVGFKRSRLARAILVRLWRALLHPYDSVARLGAGRNRTVPKSGNGALNTSQLRIHSGELRNVEGGGNSNGET